MAESMIGNLTQAGIQETGWSPMPRGKTTLKCAGDFGAGTVTFKGGKRDPATGDVKEYALGAEGVFDATTAGARNITISSDEMDFIKATLTDEDGTTDLDIYVGPIRNAT